MTKQGFMVILFYDVEGQPTVITTCDRRLTGVEFDKVDDAVGRTRMSGAVGFVMCLGDQDTVERTMQRYQGDV
jgi:hypothetical protein